MIVDPEFAENAASKELREIIEEAVEFVRVVQLETYQEALQRPSSKALPDERKIPYRASDDFAELKDSLSLARTLAVEVQRYSTDYLAPGQVLTLIRFLSKYERLQSSYFASGDDLDLIRRRLKGARGSSFLHLNSSVAGHRSGFGR